MTHPTPQGQQGYGRWFLCHGPSPERAAFDPKARNTSFICEYHASQDTVLGVTLVPGSGNNLMNDHEMRKAIARAAGMLSC